ncbi:SufE family protein [Calycomorphotria hydatis]|uniref:SufE family protein n=1 Tax=Calycomorphotria hydatis TaxID=2528027 RepID=UPI001E2C6FCA|nr:SufE family protein [Calycomorphotria hydatis]
MKVLQQLTLDELYAEFDFLNDWEERCEFLIDVGLEMADLPAEDKTEQNRVHGCQSNVWMTTELTETEPARMRIHAESDAMLVNGLIAVVLAIFDDETPQEIAATDVKPIFHRLGLDQHLSTARKNGLGGMVRRIQEDAREYLK